MLVATLPRNVKINYNQYSHGAKHSLKKYDVKFWPNTGKAEKLALSPGPSLEHFGLDVKGSNESKSTIGEISLM